MAAFGYGATRTASAGSTQKEEAKLSEEMLQFFNEVLSKFDGPNAVGQLITHFRVKVHKKEEGSTP
eukprot:8550407-Pyramimonas_sp.AAC.1